MTALDGVSVCMVVFHNVGVRVITFTDEVSGFNKVWVAKVLGFR